LYDFQVGGSILDDEVRAVFVPLLYRQFEAQLSTLQPFLVLKRDLNAAVLANSGRAGKLARFPAPVRFAFGERDTFMERASALRGST
jgi:hypothetical protein